MSYLTSSDLTILTQYASVYGLPNTRNEVIAANVGAAICQSWGSKVQPADFIPRIHAEEDLEEKLKRLGAVHDAIRRNQLST